MRESRRMCWGRPSPANTTSSARCSDPRFREETVFRCPAHREKRAAVQHPVEIYVAVDLGGERLNCGIGEILAAGEHAAKKNGGINGRDFRVRCSGAGGHVHEVIEEA